MTCLVFVFCYLLSLRRQSHLEAVLLTFKILTASKWLQRRRNIIKITRHKHKASHFYFQFCRKMEVRTYFVYFHTFPQKFKVQRTPTEFGLPVIYFDLFRSSLPSFPFCLSYGQLWLPTLLSSFFRVEFWLDVKGTVGNSPNVAWFLFITLSGLVKIR